MLSDTDAGEAQTQQGSGTTLKKTRIVWQRHTDVLPLNWGSQGEFKEHALSDDAVPDCDESTMEEACSGPNPHGANDCEVELQRVQQIANAEELTYDQTSLETTRFYEAMSTSTQALMELASAISAHSAHGTVSAQANAALNKHFDGDTLVELGDDAVSKCV